mmetsp:Transcript_75849/g.219050  ORF Transcript_75849/g.219050 Transcript_75849/m.219050 type:complete len:243 (-) Transcript_75849:15-743(-)
MISFVIVGKKGPGSWLHVVTMSMFAVSRSRVTMAMSLVSTVAFSTTTRRSGQIGEKVDGPSTISSTPVRLSIMRTYSSTFNKIVLPVLTTSTRGSMNSYSGPFFTKYSFVMTLRSWTHSVEFNLKAFLQVFFRKGCIWKSPGPSKLLTLDRSRVLYSKTWSSGSRLCHALMTMMKAMRPSKPQQYVQPTQMTCFPALSPHGSSSSKMSDRHISLLAGGRRRAAPSPRPEAPASSARGERRGT